MGRHPLVLLVPIPSLSRFADWVPTAQAVCSTEEPGISPAAAVLAAAVEVIWEMN